VPRLSCFPGDPPLYQALLTDRYLTTRVIPLIAVAAVALCVALVIIVVSVMTGFLNMVRSSGETLIGDVIVDAGLGGIPHYEQLLERIEALPEAEAAAPVVQSWGLIRFPYPRNEEKYSKPVQIWGVEPASFARVTEFGEILHWREMDDEKWGHVFAGLLRDHGMRLVQMLDEEQRLALVKRYLDHYDPQLYGTRSREAHLEHIRGFDADEWDEILRDFHYRPLEVRESISSAQWQEFIAIDPRLDDDTALLEEGLKLERLGTGDPGCVIGIAVSPRNKRQSDGSYRAIGNSWMPANQVTLTTIPLKSGRATREPKEVIFPVVNEYVSGLYRIDEMRVMIPRAEAQEMLNMVESVRYDPNGEIDEETGLPPVLGVEPARVSKILVKAREGVEAAALRDKVREIYSSFRADVAGQPDVLVVPPFGELVSVLTWEDQLRDFIGPVEKERELMRVLFMIIYFVCAGLVLSIFWAIVYEKTRDIGILRSIGASRPGILWIFLRYGLAIGVAGSIVGLGLAYLIVRNINAIHDAMGEPAPVWLWIGAFVFAFVAIVVAGWKMTRGHVLPILLWLFATIALVGLGTGLMLHKGTLIWDPSVYYFTEIPNEMDMSTVWITLVGAVIFSLIGASIPAAKAADTHAVRALRYE
jgi:lipoprotein-releasing system permease protein